MLDLKQIKKIAESIYEYAQPYCIAVYLGGSLCENIIDNPHDIDFICFSELSSEKYPLGWKIQAFLKENPLVEECDFVQIRTKQKEEHSYGSYINKRMIKLVGEDINFTFDVINKNRSEYIQILKDTVEKLLTGKIKNQKRWYQLLRGSYILINNSYEISKEQKNEINILHDLSDGWESLRDKTIEIINNL